jgi:exopolysaccharide production protein ExoZ
VWNYLHSRFESARGGSAHNLRAMEGLRGFAVALVFGVHYIALASPWVKSAGVLDFLAVIKAMGSAGVDLFFVLSGYLIYGSLIGRAQPFVAYMGRRVRRIYPAFAVVFVLYVALSFAFPAESKIPANLGGAAVYLLQNFLLLPGIFPIPPLVTVAWSLSYEMFYYLLLPALILVGGLRQRSHGVRMAVFGVLALGLLLSAAIGYGRHLRLVMFIAGIMVYALQQQAAPRSLGSAAGLIAVVLGLGAMSWTTVSGWAYALQYTALFFAFGLLCWECFNAPASPLAHAFAWTPLRWLGNMSYSYYLVHGLALKAFFLVLARVLPPGSVDNSAVFWGCLPVAFVLSLCPSALLFLAVEHPFSLAAPQRKTAAP